MFGKIVKRQGEKIIEQDNEINKLNVRCVELARQLRDSKVTNKELLRVADELKTANEKILETTSEVLGRIKKIAESNHYNNPEKIMGKIKELVHDYQSTTNSK